MGKLSMLGGLVTISGLVLLIFKVIGAVTGRELPLADQSLTDVLNPYTIEQINSMQSGFFQVFATSVVELPLYLHLIIAGIVLLLISGLVSK